MDAALDDAFERLLGASLDSFGDGEFALFVWDDMVGEEFFMGRKASEFVRAMKPRPARESDSPAADDLGWHRLGFDLARSFFLVDDFELDDEVDAAVQASAIAAAESQGIFGADLGKILKAKKANVSDIEGCAVPSNLRALTDGTLRDAMRAATWTMSAPDGLTSFEEGCAVESPWDEALASIEDAALRDHFRMLCLDAHSARSSGAFFGREMCPSEFEWLEAQGHTALAGWTFGEGQASSAVFRMRAS
ncbi:MAG: hypothetical protein AAGE52_03575 [Myxococcota bacterium]